MKKRFIILFMLLFILFGCNKKTKIVSTITLDINPSIEVGFDKDNLICSVTPLNDEAKSIINYDFMGKDLDSFISFITDKLIEEKYARDDDLLEIIVYSDGNISSNEVQNKLKDSFDKKHIDTNIIVIDSVTLEDKEVAIKNNISPAKVAYINSIINDNENISVEEFADKPVKELRDTKERGKYCDKDYTLEGDWCFKEVNRVAASTGGVCPDRYGEYKGKCYESAGILERDNLVCPKDFELVGNECIETIVTKAIVDSYSCPKGMVKTEGEIGKASYGSGPANNPVCVDENNVTHPVTVCNLPASDPTEHMSYNGKCYWHRAPVIASGCPGKKQIKGFCWDEATDVYLCPNNYNSNKRTKDDYCYKVLKGVKPVPSTYRCDNEREVLDGDKCVVTNKVEAMKERYCPDGFSLIEDRCLNLDKTTSKVNGLYCEDENAKLNGNECIIYEMKDAYNN